MRSYYCRIQTQIIKYNDVLIQSGPGSLNCSCCEGKAELAPTDEGEIWCCEKKKGFISQVIEDIITRRLKIKELLKKEKDEKFEILDARQKGLKLMANSFYGYLGFYAARWYSLNSAQATTGYGRYYIKKVISKAEAENFKVIYSDTDSVFLTLEGKKKEDALEFVDVINKDMPGLMELEFDGFYPSGRANVNKPL